MKTISERIGDLAPVLAARFPKLSEPVIADLLIIQALDEWQATVEERLGAIEQHPALSIPSLCRFPELRGPLAGLPAVAVVDSGASKYEPEPDDGAE